MKYYCPKVRSIFSRLNIHRHTLTNGYRINLYCSSSFLLSDLTISIVIPYGTNSLYMSVYFLSVVFCIFRLSFLFELRPLIEEIDDHWLTLYVFYDSFSTTSLKCRWYIEDKKKKGWVPVCFFKKNHWYSSWHIATDLWPLNLKSTLEDSYLDNELLITYTSLSDSSDIYPSIILLT
jgi:hypothetical protein